MTLTRRYRFSSSHRLHSRQLSDEQNRETYGKCNNPYGHGHDYVLDVSVSGPLDEITGRIVDLESLDHLVRGRILDSFEHRNLNVEVPAFSERVPTTENVAVEIGRRLREAWPQVFSESTTQLQKIRIHETPRNIFELSL